MVGNLANLVDKDRATRPEPWFISQPLTRTVQHGLRILVHRDPTVLVANEKPSGGSPLWDRVASLTQPAEETKDIISTLISEARLV